MADAGIVAVICIAETKVVGTAVPFNCATVAPVKLVPVSVRLVAVFTGIIPVEIELNVGGGGGTISTCKAFEVVGTVPELTTVTDAVAGFASRLAGTIPTSEYPELRL